MSDARYPERWLHDRRIQRLTDRSYRAFVISLAWAVSNRTDGYIEPEDLPLLAPSGFGPGSEDELVASGLWLETDRRWLIEPFAATQTSSAELVTLEKARQSNRRRQELFRNPELRQSIRFRDGDKCRYCGRQPDWSDRRSTAGGTYDHIDPDGPSTYENCCVACRGCNSRKGHRTPEQAGMPLLPCNNSGFKTGSKTGVITTQDRTGQDSLRSSCPTQGEIPTEDPSSSKASVVTKSGTSPAEPPKRKTSLKPDWRPSEKAKELSRTKYGHLNLNEELDAFRNHHISRGNRMVDWDRAWYNWLRNSKRFATSPAPTNGHRPSTTDRIVADIQAMKDRPDQAVLALTQTRKEIS